MATQDWQTLTRLTAGAAFEIERVRLTAQDVAIEGRFEVPPLAQLTAEDQTFVAAFIRCHGSIKQMEQFFGVSYPTIKNRLNRIGSLLPFAEIDPEPQPQLQSQLQPQLQSQLQPQPPRPAASTGELLTQLERGALTVDQVLRQLRKPEDRK
jgi:hypothetical protein